MHSYLDRLRRWLRSDMEKNASVQAEATMETLRRARIFGVAVLLLNIIYTLEFWLHTTGQESPARASWANGIGWTHFVMGLTMLAVTLMINNFYRRAHQPPALAIALQVLFCGSCLMFATALSVIDQLVTPNTTNFAMICLVVAMTSLMRPGMTVPIFLVTYLIFFKALAVTQMDPDLLAIARSHSVSAVLMSVVASIVVWRQYVAGVLMRREIVLANKEITNKQAELAYMATRDSLTGLYVRREFLRLAEMELARAARFPTDTGVLMLDLDFFKRINDEYGHPAGDEVLQQVAAILKAGVRVTDVIGRMGGEEFIVLLPNTTRDGAVAVAEKLRTMVRAHPLKVEDALVPVTASLGVSGLAQRQPGSIERLYAAADQALYAAKQLGRDRVEYAAPQVSASPSDLAALRRADSTCD